MHPFFHFYYCILLRNLEFYTDTFLCDTHFELDIVLSIFHFSYFLLNFAAPPTSISDIVDHSQRDIDVLRPYVFKTEPPAQVQCTLHEEIKPPPYRYGSSKLVFLTIIVTYIYVQACPEVGLCAYVEQRYRK